MDALQSSIPAPKAKERHWFINSVASPQFSFWLMSILLVWEFSILCVKSYHRLFWYDELITFHVSGLQPFSFFWNALKTGADGMPLGYYLLVRSARLIPADPRLTLRLPSMVGYLLVLIGVYWFARKLSSPIVGLTAAFLMTLSPLREYALEARSYCLLVGFLSIAAACWQRIDEKRFMTPLFAIFLTMAVSCHQLAIVSISAFAIAELTYTLLSRTIRWGVWASVLLATVPFFIGLPNLLHYKEIFGKTFWAKPKWSMAVTTYGLYLGINRTVSFLSPPQSPGLLIFVLAVIGGAVLCAVRQPKAVSDSIARAADALRNGIREREFNLPQIVLLGGFFIYPALLVVITKLLGSGYTGRYGWPAILGLVLGSVYLARTTWLRSHSVPILAVLLVCFVFQGVSDCRVLSKTGGLNGIENRWTTLALFSRSQPDLAVAIGNPLAFLEASEYAPLELRDRLVEVADHDAAIRLVRTDTSDLTNILLSRFVPLHVEDLSRFQTAHQSFLLFSGGVYDWFTRYIAETGSYRLRLLSKDGDTEIYLAQRGEPQRLPW